jgi:hypothetical protein
LEVTSAHCGQDARVRTVGPVLAAAVLVSGTLDALTTLAGLRAGLRENNPLARLAFDEFGVATTLVARVVLPFVLFGCVMYWAARRDRQLFALTAAAVMFAVACWMTASANNLVALASAR